MNYHPAPHECAGGIFFILFYMEVHEELSMPFANAALLSNTFFQKGIKFFPCNFLCPQTDKVISSYLAVNKIKIPLCQLLC